jgi:SAM-dependent methyltransferase/cephalosporin-C deacetylase-like acetyl esterase
MTTTELRSGVLSYIEPEDLLREIRADPLPLSWEVVRRWQENGVDCSELRLLTEIIDGAKIHMHAWLARPAGGARLLPTLLAIPGGMGTTDPDFVQWVARKCQVLVLGVDWVGAGGSDSLPGIDPWEDAVLVLGDDYRSSFQYHNLRALYRATEFLLSQSDADPKRLMASGGSWGGFYSWLLAGIDQRFSYIFPTYGCGFLDTETRQTWESDFASMDPEKAEEWLRAFDPGRRAHLIRAKVFYQQCTNDKYYSLLASMRTYRRVRSEKRLLLIRNQDHTTEPFGAHDVLTMRAVLDGTLDQELPSLHGVRWVPGTTTVELDAERTDGATLSVVFSGGDYTKSFGRHWRSVPVERVDDRLVAEIPVVAPERELWLYGHATRESEYGPMGISTPVIQAVPADLGVAEPTARFDPAFDFASGEFWQLPIGDRQHPQMRLVEDGGVTALSIRFDSDAARRGIAYCLEGDLIASHGHNAVEVMVRVPAHEDLKGLHLCLDVDFHALSEQVYAVPLEELGDDFTEWRTVRVPFSKFEPHLPRAYYKYVPPLRPLDVSRLCGVGLFHPDRKRYTGEGMIAKIRTLRLPDAPDVPPADEGRGPAWPLRRARFADFDPLAVPDGPVEEPKTDRPADIDPYDFYVQTPLSPEELRRRLKAWEPWRHEIIFSNGVRTTEFERAPRFFVDHSLETWHVFGRHVPEEHIRGGRALDVGSNTGHYSIFLRQRYDMSVVGLETNQRNVDVASFILETSGLDRVEFLNEDGATYVDPEPFDLILHFGTLDHLKNPFLAIENAAAMLNPGGYLLLEFQTYKDADDERVCLFAKPVRAEGTTCWWFLGKEAVLAMLDEAGFREVNVVLEWGSPKIGDAMRRLHVVARK